MVDDAKTLHAFDADGKSALNRRELERENAILKARVEALEHQNRGLLLKIAAAGLLDERHTLH